MTAHAIGFAFYLATNAILIAVALLVATPAIPAEFERYPQPNGRPDHIVVSGGIRTNDERKFVELTADLKDATTVVELAFEEAQKVSAAARDARPSIRT